MFSHSNRTLQTENRNSAVPWAMFLASSWTWCIGMYLPVLLVRDYGLWGWVVFAVPNVVGAAAMGWIIRDGASSRSLVERHRLACSAFTLVTIAFQWYFAAWGHQLVLMALIGFVISLAMMSLFPVGDRLAAGLVYLVSLACGLVLIRQGVAFTGLGQSPINPHLASSDLVRLTPVMFFGFLLCPYLDLTFHRARQALDAGAARLAFSLGFGVFFLAMILLSLAYTGVAKGELGLAPEAVGVALGLHVGVQLGFTIAAHLREATDGHARGGFLIHGIVAAVLGILPALLVTTRGWTHVGLDAGEIIYRLFMAFYGLVFPAYVWLCMIPTRGRQTPSRRAWLVLGGAVLLAAPLYWMGFIEQRMIWLAPGIAVVLTSRLMLPWRAQKREEP